MQTTKQESEGSTLVLKTMAVVTRRDQKLDYVSLFIGASPHVITTHDTIGESEVSVDLQIGLLSSKKFKKPKKVISNAACRFKKKLVLVTEFHCFFSYRPSCQVLYLFKTRRKALTCPTSFRCLTMSAMCWESLPLGSPKPGENNSKDNFIQSIY